MKDSESDGDESENSNALNLSSQIDLKLDYVYRAERFLHTKVLVEFIILVWSQRQNRVRVINRSSI